MHLGCFSVTPIRRHGTMRFAAGVSRKLRTGHELMPMMPCNHIFHEPAKLRVQLDRDGFLYLKNVIPRSAVVRAFTDVANQLADNGWTRECDAERQILRNGFSYNVPFLLGNAETSKNGPSAIPRMTKPLHMTKALSQVVVGSSVMAAVRQVFGGTVCAYDHSDLDIVHPGEASGFSMPSVYCNKGTKLLLVAWIPLHDCPLRTGGPIIAQGSNQADSYAPIRRTYGTHEVEDGKISGDGTFTSDAEELLSYGCPLVSTAFESGDLVLSTVYTMQGLVNNESDHWRLSVCSRWMMEGDDVGPDPRYCGRGASGLTSWRMNNNNSEKYPMSMEDAKKEWGVDVPPRVEI